MSILSKKQAAALQALSSGLEGKRGQRLGSVHANSSRDAMVSGAGFNPSYAALLGSAYQRIYKDNLGPVGPLADMIGSRLRVQSGRRVLAASQPSKSSAGTPARMDNYGQTITAPAQAGYRSKNEVKLSIGGAKGFGKIPGGIRLTVKFLAPGTWAPGNSGALTASTAQGWNNTGNGQNVLGLYLNPGADSINLGIATDNSVNGVFYMNVFNLVPKLAALARCFTRFRFQSASVDSVAHLQPAATGNATQGSAPTSPVPLNGSVRFAYCSDLIKPLERDWSTGNTGGAWSEQDFQWLSNVQNGCQFPFWSAQERYTFFTAAAPKDECDFFYVMLGTDDAASYGPLIPGAATLRQNVQGVLLCGQDVGVNYTAAGAATTSGLLLRRNWLTVVLDLHEITMGNPSNSNIRWLHAGGEKKERTDDESQDSKDPAPRSLLRLSQDDGVLIESSLRDTAPAPLLRTTAHSAKVSAENTVPGTPASTPVQQNAVLQPFRGIGSELRLHVNQSGR